MSTLKPVKHLTHEGPLAGITFCRNLFKGDTKAHANIGALGKDTYRATICPKCLAMWDQSGEEE